MTQEEYIEILFDDLGFGLKGRKDWLQLRYERRFADELTPSQKGLVIRELKAQKETESPMERDDRDESED